MATTPENQPRPTQTPEGRIRGLELSRERLLNVFDNLGTPEYKGKGGSGLSFTGTTGDELTEKRYRVGKAKKSVVEKNVPNISRKILDIKASVNEALVEEGYLPALVLSEHESEEVKPEETLTPGRIVEVDRPQRRDTVVAAQPQRDERPAEKIDENTLSDVRIDEEAGRMVIDGREINLDPSGKIWQVILHLWGSRNAYAHRDELQKYLVSIDIGSSPSAIIYEIRKQLGDLENRQVVKSTGGGPKGASYGIFAKTDESPAGTNTKEEVVAASTPSLPERDAVSSVSQKNNRQELPEEIDESTLRNVSVDTASGIVMVGGREVKFKTGSNAWEVFLHYWGKRNTVVPNAETEKLMRELGVYSPAFAQVQVVRRTLGEEDGHQILRTSRGKGFGIFVKTDEDTSHRKADLETHFERGQAPGASLVDIFVATADTAMSPRLMDLRVQALTGETRQQTTEIDFDKQRLLNLNTSLTLIGNLLSNNPDDKIVDDAVTFVRGQAKIVMLDAPSEDERMKKITGVQSDEELRAFFRDSFVSTLKEFWGLTREQTDGIVGAKERLIARRCGTLAEKGVAIDQVVREVCRFFKLETPDEYAGDSYNPEIGLHSSGNDSQ